MRQHDSQRHFDAVQQVGHALGLQLFAETGAERGQQTGFGSLGAGKGRRRTVAGGQRGRRVFPRQRIFKISGQPQVEGDMAEALLAERHQQLAVGAILFERFVGKEFCQLTVGEQRGAAAVGHLPAAVRPASDIAA